MNSRNYLIEQYLDFKNNYLTVALFAEHRGILDNIDWQIDEAIEASPVMLESYPLIEKEKA